MKNKPKVTIGIPVYNVEKYIEKCLNSVFNQTYENIYVLLACDLRSQDDSVILAERFMKNSKFEYDLIKYKYQKSSLGLARNLLIENHKGDYLYFLDSDDYLERSCIEILTYNATKYDVDIVKSSHRHVDINGKELKKSCYPKKILMNNKDLQYNIYVNNNFHSVYSWNKLYKSSFIKDFNFKYIHDFYEDIFFSFMELNYSNKVILLPGITHNYLIRENSITNVEPTYEKLNVFLENKELISKNFNKKKSIVNYCCEINIFIMTYIMIVRDGYKSSLISQEKRNELLKGAFKTPYIPLVYIPKILISKKFKLILLLIIKMLSFNLNMTLVKLYHIYKN